MGNAACWSSPDAGAKAQAAWRYCATACHVGCRDPRCAPTFLPSPTPGRWMAARELSTCCCGAPASNLMELRREPPFLALLSVSKHCGGRTFIARRPYALHVAGNNSLIHHARFARPQAFAKSHPAAVRPARRHAKNAGFAAPKSWAITPRFVKKDVLVEGLCRLPPRKCTTLRWWDAARKTHSFLAAGICVQTGAGGIYRYQAVDLPATIR